MQALTFCDGKFMSTRTAAGQFKGQFKGAMEESSGQVQAHPRSGVVMDTAAFKVSHSVVSNKDATALRAVIARLSSIGAMDESSGKFKRCKHTEEATLSWILHPSKLATPVLLTKMPPPCKPKGGARNVVLHG